MAGREIVFGSGTASPTGGCKRVRKRAPMFTYYPKPIVDGRACDIGSRPCVGEREARRGDGGQEAWTLSGVIANESKIGWRRVISIPASSWRRVNWGEDEV